MTALTGVPLTNAQMRARNNNKRQEEALEALEAKRRQREESERAAAALFYKAAAEEPQPRSRRAVRLSAAIMAHPQRADMVQLLAERLDDEAPVVWDEIQSRWDTGRRAMLAYDPRATHHVVLQDDILIPRNLLAGLKRMLHYVPSDVPICGYVGRLRPQQDRVRDLVAKARAVNASFLTMRQLHWGPLIVVPVKHIDAMIAHCDPLNIPNYDMRISRYWEDHDYRVWYTWPSVVDHADGPSLVPGRITTRHATSSRIAHEFCGEEVSVLDLPWDGPVISGR